MRESEWVSGERERERREERRKKRRFLIYKMREKKSENRKKPQKPTCSLHNAHSSLPLPNPFSLHSFFSFFSLSLFHLEYHACIDTVQGRGAKWIDCVGSGRAIEGHGLAGGGQQSLDFIPLGNMGRKERVKKETRKNEERMKGVRGKREERIKGVREKREEREWREGW